MNKQTNERAIDEREGRTKGSSLALGLKITSLPRMHFHFPNPFQDLRPRTGMMVEGAAEGTAHYADARARKAWCKLIRQQHRH
jgi:hypothetical protein